MDALGCRESTMAYHDTARTQSEQAYTRIPEKMSTNSTRVMVKSMIASCEGHGTHAPSISDHNANDEDASTNARSTILAIYKVSSQCG